MHLDSIFAACTGFATCGNLPTLKEYGLTVLAVKVSMEETGESVSVPILRSEAFVHGAMCISYSDVVPFLTTCHWPGCQPWWLFPKPAVGNTISTICHLARTQEYQGQVPEEYSICQPWTCVWSASNMIDNGVDNELKAGWNLSLRINSSQLLQGNLWCLYGKSSLLCHQDDLINELWKELLNVN